MGIGGKCGPLSSGNTVGGGRRHTICLFSSGCFTGTQRSWAAVVGNEIGVGPNMGAERGCDSGQQRHSSSFLGDATMVQGLLATAQSIHVRCQQSKPLEAAMKGATCETPPAQPR